MTAVGMTTVAVIGGGAIGGYLATAAAAAGHQVTLCVRTPIAGLRAESAGRARVVPVRIAAEPGQVSPAELILLATKTYQTRGTLPWLRRLIGPGSTLVAAQNGVDDRAVTALFRQPLGIVRQPPVDLLAHALAAEASPSAPSSATASALGCPPRSWRTCGPGRWITAPRCSATDWRGGRWRPVRSTRRWWIVAPRWAFQHH